MADKEKGYEFFEHTADVGMRASGKTLADLFTNCAQGLVELLVEDSAIKIKETRSVKLHSDSVDGLLQVWLTELIGWFDIDKFLLNAVDFKSVTETDLQASVAGDRFDPMRHHSGKEVKAVTRHQFSVKRTERGWQSNIIFDV